MVSNLITKGTQGPCLKMRDDPPEQVLKILGLDHESVRTVSSEDYCAAHLAMLCKFAQEAQEKVRKQDFFLKGWFDWLVL